MKSIGFWFKVAMPVLLGGWLLGLGLGKAFSPRRPLSATSLIASSLGAPPIETPPVTPPLVAPIAESSSSTQTEKTIITLFSEPDPLKRLSAERLALAQCDENQTKALLTQLWQPELIFTREGGGGLDDSKLTTINGKNHDLTKIALERLFSLNPVRAVAYINSPDFDGHWYRQSLHTLFGMGAKPDSDGAKAFQDVSKTRPIARANMNGNLSLIALGVWANYDPAGAWQATFTPSAPGATGDQNFEIYERQNRQAAVIDAYVKLDPASAMAKINSLATLNDQKPLIEAAMNAWAQSDLPAALTYVNTLPKGEFRSKALTDIFNAGVKVDPGICLNGILRFNQDPELQSQLFYQTGSILGGSDPKLALNFAQSLSDEKLKSSLLVPMFNFWNKNDPATARDYALNQLTGLPQQQILNNLAATIAQSDPALALQWIDHVPPGKTKEQATGRIIWVWAATDPESTAAWVNELPDGVAKNAATSNLIRVWTYNDPSASGDWLKAQSPGRTRDAGLSAYAYSIAAKDGATSLDWASSISDPDLQSKTLLRLYKQYSRKDPNGATAWLQNSSITQDLKNQLAPPPPAAPTPTPNSTN